jgi:integrase
MPAKTPSLYRSRHGVFYLRVCLPEAERSNPKSKEVWRSLRTKDAKIAKGLALRFAIEKNYAMPTKSPKTIADEIANPLSFTSREGHRIDFDPAKPEEVQFAKEFIAEHTAKAAEIMRDDDRRLLAETELEFRRKEAEALRHREALLAAKPPVSPPSPLFSKYMDAYLALIKNSDITERTKKGYAAKLKVFQDFIGKSATVAEITPDKMLDFQTWLAKDDPLTDRKAITPRSIDEYSNVISNVYKKVIKKAADNPIEGRLVGKKQRMKSNRKPFTPDELTRIFDPTRLATVKNPADFFVPILGLLTGSRPASICQLRVGDIRREDGITVIHYHDYLEGNSAKTRATNRIAPLHPLLEQVGFLRYLEDVKSLPDTNATTLIFPWLNQYEQGFADVPTQNFRSQYIGHENDSVNNRTYGGETPAKFLLESVIPHLQFDEIQWDAIQYKRDMPTMEREIQIAKRRDAAKSNQTK